MNLGKLFRIGLPAGAAAAATGLGLLLLAGPGGIPWPAGGLPPGLRDPGLDEQRPLPEAVPAVRAVPPPDQPEHPALLLEGSVPVPVLMYHDVRDRPEVYFDVATDELREQFEQLRSAGASVIPLADLYEHLRAGAPLPPRPVVLTFDDGYLGQYENAYPLLKEFGYPATFFVPTGTVGVKTSRDHMTWEQLQTLDREGLVQVEPHSITHPEDLRLLPLEDLRREIRESKRLLEAKLGRPARFFCYPKGNADSRVARETAAAGFRMAFTMGPEWTAAPEDAFLAPRVIESRLDEVLARLGQETAPPVVRPRVIGWRPTDLETGFLEDGQVKLRWVKGGRMYTARLEGRQDVRTFMQRGFAPVGLNGTFFSDARVAGQGAEMVGPVLTRFGAGFDPGLPGDRPRVEGRPLVIAAPDRIAFLPFRPRLAGDLDGVRRLVPGATDCFLGGGWLVHRGRPLSRPELERFRLAPMWEFRPRALVGVDREGRPMLAATSTGNQVDRVALTAALAGFEECVLLDSGFSTSLVLGQQVLIRGIRRDDMPARPVPHAFLLYPVDPFTGQEVLAVPPALPDQVGPPYRPDMREVERRFRVPLPPAEDPEDPEFEPHRLHGP